MSTFLKDLRYALRTLFQKPGVTIVAIIALGLAIGSSSAMFSVVNAVILKPLSFDDSENVVIVWESAPKLHFNTFSVSPANFADWQKQAKSFEAMAAYQRSQFTLTGTDAAERVPGALVSADYFKLVKTPAMIGRTLLPEEAMPGKDKVVVVSYGFWNRRLGKDPLAVGKTLILNGESYNVVGVMPERFMYPSNSDIWAPMDVNATMTRGGHFLVALGRLNPSVSVDTATAEMKKISADLAQAYPSTNDNWTTKVVNLHDDIIKDLRESLYILLGAVGFVLLIACSNVANLLLAQGRGRRQGNGGTHRDGRQPDSNHPSVINRKRAAVAGRWCVRHHSRLRDTFHSRRHGAGESASNPGNDDGLLGVGIRCFHFNGDRPWIRPVSGISAIAHQPARHPQGGGARFVGWRGTSSDPQFAGGRGNRPDHRRPDRRRPYVAEPRQAVRRRSRIQSAQLHVLTAQFNLPTGALSPMIAAQDRIYGSDAGTVSLPCSGDDPRWERHPFCRCPAAASIFPTPLPGARQFLHRMSHPKP